MLAAGALLAGYGLVELLWHQHPELPGGTRGLVLWLVLQALVGVVLWASLPDPQGRIPARALGRTVGVLASLCLAASLHELTRFHAVPGGLVSDLATGTFALWMGQATGGLGVGMLGAWWIYSAVSGAIASEFGLALGMLTDAVFVSLGTGLAVAFLALTVLGPGAARASLATVGLTAANLAMLALSVFAHGYLGWEDAAWVDQVAYLGFLVLGVLSIRIAATAHLLFLSRLTAQLLSLRVLATWTWYTAETLPAWATALGVGILFLVSAALLERLGTPSGVLEEDPRPWVASLGSRRRALALCLVLGVVLPLAPVMQGAWNASGAPVHEVAVPGRAQRVHRFLTMAYNPFDVLYPFEKEGGTRLDLYLEVAWWGDLPDLPGAAVAIERAIAVEAGAARPPRLRPGLTLRMPARLIDIRLLEGTRIRFVLPEGRLAFELGPEDLASWTPGSSLVLREGRLGWIHPAGWRRP